MAIEMKSTHTQTVILTAIVGAAFVSATSAGIINAGGDAVIADPPSNILHNQWENNSEIRAWFERETTLTQDIHLGHSQSGLVDDLSQLDGNTVTSGTQVQSYMIRLDPVGQGPVTLSGYLTFDTEILGVYIGSQLVPTDAIFGRSGVVYNANPFRGLELDGALVSNDTFEISQDLMRIDFTMEVGDWTDDIRVITAVPTPGSVGVLAAGLFAATRRRRG